MREIKSLIQLLKRGGITIYALTLTLALALTPDKIWANSTGSASLQEEIQKFSIAKDYFSDILSSQLQIFSLILVALLAINWLYQRKVTKDEIKEEVGKQINAIKKELNDELDLKQKALVDVITGRLNQGDIDINLLRGEVYRSMAQFWDSQSSFSTAFIWWTRAAFYFSLIKDENMARMCLGAAKRSVERVGSGYELGADIMGESQRLISLIDNNVYRVEKDLLYEALKIALNKGLSLS